jgi:hypothetical protein
MIPGDVFLSQPSGDHPKKMSFDLPFYSALSLAIKMKNDFKEMQEKIFEDGMGKQISERDSP